MRRRHRPKQESDNPDRWMVSYADFITLLFAFFVLMYAVSSDSEGKFEVLTSTLSKTFSTADQSASPSEGHVVASKPEEEVKDPSLSKLQDLARNKVMKQISEEVTSTLKPLIDQGVVDVTRNSLWVEINIKSNILFKSGDAILQVQARPTLAELAAVLRRFPNEIQVEGHTDNIPISNNVFPSNWELSAARAANVVNLLMTEGVAPERLSAIGYGEHRPLVVNDSDASRGKNRRVAVFILADDSARRIIDTTKAEAALNRYTPGQGGSPVASPTSQSMPVQPTILSPR